MKKKNRKLGKKYSHMKFRRLKYFSLIVGLAGLCLSFLGNILDQRNKWVAKIFSHDYEKANKAYMNMLNNAQEIKKTDPGFDLILDVISEYVDGPIENISSLKARRNALIAFLGDYTGPSILLSITDKNGYTDSLIIRDLKPDIEKHFFYKPLLLWGNGIFYFGLLLTLFLILAEFVNKK